MANASQLPLDRLVSSVNLSDRKRHVLAFGLSRSPKYKAQYGVAVGIVCSDVWSLSFLVMREAALCRVVHV